MNPSWPFAPSALFWFPICLFTVVAIGLSWDWYRVNKRERLHSANTWREAREASISTAHLTQSFEEKAAKGFARAPRIVPTPDRRQEPKIH